MDPPVHACSSLAVPVTSSLTFSPLLQRGPGDVKCQGCELTPLYLPETSLPPSKRVKNVGVLKQPAAGKL